MTELQKNIYEAFSQNEDLHVLFIFDENGFIGLELDVEEWKPGYHYASFDEQCSWFTIKYRIDNDWKDDKVILLFHQPSPLKSKQLAEKFPLLDLLVANMEYQQEGVDAFMRKYNIPETMHIFVEKNITQLQSSPMKKLLMPFYQDRNINTDIAVRGFISKYMDQQRVLDWDTIIVRLILLGAKSEEKKQTAFYVNLRKSPMTQDALKKKLESIFSISYNDNDADKIVPIVRIFKYNALVQNLAAVEADNYKECRIKDTFALQHINRILELALSQDRFKEPFLSVLQELGADIRESEIIRWYGTEANYYFLPGQLCVPILKTMMEDQIDKEPTQVINRVEELMSKIENSGEIVKVINYILTVARFYEKALSASSFTLNTPNDYITRYTEDYYQFDQFYRKSIEAFFDVSPSYVLFDSAKKVKNDLDIVYHKICNRINLEWTKCILETGGFASVNLLRQQDFYDTLIKPIQKKVAIVVVDALRYELAEELISELAKSKHTASLKPALAMLPTETKFCKPALLPHNHLMLYTKGEGVMDMAVDDKILDSTDKRSAHAASFKADALCIPFEVVAEYDREKNREIFKHAMVYVFHDSIDTIGHKGTSKQLIQHARQSIQDIAEMIPKIHATYNVREVYITADHGFLFNDIVFEEKDKQKVEETALEKTSRYYLTESDQDVIGIMKFPLKEVSGMDSDVFVAVPAGTNRLAAPSGGYTFTHGGASLQEMVIPIITSRLEIDNNKKPVNVMVLDRNLSIQASRIRFRLLQTDPVSMEYRERTITVGLYNNDVPVSPIKTILLDKTDTSLENRKYLVDLTLNQNVDSKVLQLKVYDETDQLNPLLKENVTNKTLIDNDFDF